MTSDDAFPIEDRIAPLVYAFHQLNQCPPCWSCEGHLDLDGTIKRLPAVWFYASSQVFAGMIWEYVASLWLKKQTNASWRVVVAVTEPHGMEPAYSLEPEVPDGSSLTLAELQSDIDVIAQDLVSYMQDKTQDLIQQVDAYLTDT